MTHTAIFSDAKMILIPSTRKNGRTKYDWISVQVEDTLHPVEINFNGTKKVFYVRSMEMAKDNKRVNLYNFDGSYARGTWKHGREGSKLHNDTLELYKETMKLVCVDSYQSGQIKDQKKYLMGI